MTRLAHIGLAAAVSWLLGTAIVCAQSIPIGPSGAGPVQPSSSASATPPGSSTSSPGAAGASSPAAAPSVAAPGYQSDGQQSPTQASVTASAVCSGCVAYETSAGLAAYTQQVTISNTGNGGINVNLPATYQYNGSTVLVDVGTNFGCGAGALAGNLGTVSGYTPNTNTGCGYEALHSATATAKGAEARSSAFGDFALFTDTIGTDNTAIGYAALFSNTVDPVHGAGFQNTAIGSRSLYTNTYGSDNTAAGFESLFSNKSGQLNSAYGAASMLSCTSCFDSVAFGYMTLYAIGKPVTASELVYGISFSGQQIHHNYTVQSGAGWTGCGASSDKPGTVFTPSSASCSASGYVTPNSQGDDAFGQATAFHFVDGEGNTFIGDEVALSLVTGDANTLIGADCDVGAEAFDTLALCTGEGAKRIDYNYGTAGALTLWPATYARASVDVATYLMIGSPSALTLSSGEVGLARLTSSGSGTAPGAAGGKFELVCGTTRGTAKLIVYAGTSATAATILDNIGAGVAGC